MQTYAAAPQTYAAAPQTYAAAPQTYAAAPQTYAAASQRGSEGSVEVPCARRCEMGSLEVRFACVTASLLAGMPCLKLKTWTWTWGCS